MARWVEDLKKKKYEKFFHSKSVNCNCRLCLSYLQRRAMTIGHTFRNVAELAQISKFSGAKHATFNKIFDVKVFNPECRASPELSQKYGKGACASEGFFFKISDLNKLPFLI